MKSFLKRAYHAVPFKKELFLLLKSIWSPPESIYKHLYFKGVFKVPVEHGKFFIVRHYGFAIENMIFWKGLKNSRERVSMSLWIKLCEKSNTVFDIGANTGIFSLVAKTMNPDAHVYAMEPVHRVYEKLVENTALNNFDVKCFEYAASDFNGTATIYDNMAEHILSVTVNKNLNFPSVKVVPVEIKTKKLSTIIEDENISNIDLIKLDVETHEFEVLNGMGDFLESFKPTILIEILNDEVGTNVESLVKDLGYLFFNIDEKNGVRQVQKITKSDYFNYLLCSERVALELELIK